MKTTITPGSKITLTNDLEQVEGAKRYHYPAGTVGRCIAIGRKGDPTILVAFKGRPRIAFGPELLAAGVVAAVA